MLAGYFGLMQIYDIIDYPGKRRAFVSYLRRNGRDAPENRFNEWKGDLHVWAMFILGRSNI